MESELDQARLHEALLRRAEEAVRVAAELVAESEVRAHLLTDVDVGDLVARCSWCGRYRAGARWVFVEPGWRSLAHRTTHSICDDCVAALRETGMSV